MCFRPLTCIILLLSALVCRADSEYRTFTGQDGGKIEAKIIEANEKVISIQFPDGRVFKDVELGKFSSEDQKFIRKWLKQKQAAIDNAEINADSKISIRFVRGRDDDLNNYGDIDDRIVKFEPEVVLQSDDIYKTYTEIKGTFVVIGQQIMGEKRYALLSRQDFTAKVPPGEEARCQGERFSCRYDPDYGGFEYSGYLVVLRDRSGKIVMAKAARTAWANSPEALLKAKPYTGYNSDFTKDYKLYTTFGLPRN